MVHPSHAPIEPAIDPLASDPFPRERLTALLGEAEAARERRHRAQVWTLGIGLAILALGLPSERLWGEMDLVRMTAGNGERSTGIVFPTAVGLRTLTGTSAEQVCFLIAALCYGLCLPAITSLLRTIGIAPGLSLVSASTALISATVWLGATQPGDFAPGVLGSALLLRTLFQPRERMASGYLWRAALLLALAFLLRPENLLLFPAVAWAVSRRRGRLAGPLPGLVLALVMGLCLIILLGPNPARSDLGVDLLDTLLAGRQPGLGALPGWGLQLAGLGVGLFGLHALLLGRRLPEEAPAPRWMVPWCLVVLAPVVGGSAAHGPVGGYLVPAVAVGLADWLTRRDREERARRCALFLLATQVLLTTAVAFAWNLGDPLREWRARAQTNLETDDVAVVADPRHAYLLEQRFGLATLPADPQRAGPPALAPELAATVASGARRLVLVPAAEDAPGGSTWPPTGRVLDERVDVWVLTARGLVRVPAGAPYGFP